MLMVSYRVKSLNDWLKLLGEGFGRSASKVNLPRARPRPANVRIYTNIGPMLIAADDHLIVFRLCPKGGVPFLLAEKHGAPGGGYEDILSMALRPEDRGVLLYALISGGKDDKTRRWTALAAFGGAVKRPILFDAES